MRIRDPWKLLRQPGLTDEQVRVLNWLWLVFLVVAWLGYSFTFSERQAWHLVGRLSASYAGCLLILPPLLRRTRPDAPVETERAWAIGLAGYGGVGLTHLLRGLTALL